MKGADMADDKKEPKEKKPTGEARIDALVQKLNAHLNTNLEPDEDTGR